MSEDGDIICFICARGGSKGVKDKNIRELAGKPLIAYTIEQALKWDEAKHVVVSTDSKKIADVARRYGAEVPFERPKELASDNSAKLPVVRHALIESEKRFGERYKIVVDLVANNIQRVPDLLLQFLFFLKYSKSKFALPSRQRLYVRLHLGSEPAVPEPLGLKSQKVAFLAVQLESSREQDPVHRLTDDRWFGFEGPGRRTIRDRPDYFLQ